MSGKEKIYFLLIAINDARTIAPSGQPLSIDPVNDLNWNYRDIELKQLFTKLEKDEKILKVLKASKKVNSTLGELDPDPYNQVDDAEDGLYHIELLPAFDGYFLKIQQEPEYQKFTGKKTKNEVVDSKPTVIPTKYDRKALEKIWNVLQEIDEKKQLGIEGNPVRVPCYLEYGQDSDEIYEARKTILEKLQSLGAITGLHKGVTGAYYYWSFSLGNDYESVFNNYKIQYKKSAKDYQEAHPEEKTNPQEIAYEVKYSETSREIIINGFLVGKPDFNRENEIVFTYVYKHPNERLSKLKIEKDNSVRLLKDLPKIVENLGFTGELKKAFFEVSTEGILFRNPVTRKVLNELRIEHLKLK